MGKPADLTGMRFGRLRVINRAPRNPIYGSRQWNCICVCGNAKVADGRYLKNGLTKSCGCLSRDHMAAVATTHGYTSKGKRPTEFTAYVDARARCSNPKRANYRYYGGRGIEFRFASFESFIAELGPKPTLKHSLDRIDNNGHYEPGNVRWATQSEQLKNRRAKRLAPVIT